MKESNIIRLSREEIESQLRQGLDDTDWRRIEEMTEDEIERLALEENAELGIPDDWYRDAIPVIPGEKESVTLILDRGVVDYFKEKGDSYKSMMNAVLRDYVQRQTENNGVAGRE